MARERLNAIDVAISVSNLKKLLNNITLVNIYDITNRVFILKFSKNENKIYVLIEIGCRIHATQFLRSVDHLPSNFNAKLRKHLRNRRLRDVSQMSQDRIIDFTFSSEEHALHLIIQLFLPGNIYLTDHEYKVLTVLKPKNTGDNFYKVGSNYAYNLDYNSWFEPVKRVQVEDLLMSNKLTDLVRAIYPSIHNGFILSALKLNSGNTDEDVKKLDRKYTLEELDLVYQYVESVRQCLVGLLTRKDKVPGYIYRNPKGEMEDFGPFELPNSEYHEDYNYAIDAFFTKNELVKQEKKTVSKKPTKLTKIKVDQDKRESKLMDEIMGYTKQIKVLEDNIDIVDNCLNLTKALIASGASWNDIYEQLQIQRKQNHPLVCYIKDINIPNQTLTFVNTPEGTKMEGDGKEEVVVLDYRLTGYQNLKKFYINRKKSENKLERTKIGREYALKKVAKSLNKNTEVKKQDRRARDVRISSLRKRFWFEKFYWFITSQGYLVLAGRDSLQNEILVKKYLTKGDLYFHADIHGASSVILKTNSQDMIKSMENMEEKEVGNVKEDEFISTIKISIEEAANFAVCHSNAWNDKFSVQSWWVYWHQVSKTPPSGEYVPQGSFVVRGKKNYLQPQKLEMGITYLFQVHQFQPLDYPEENENAKKEDVEEGEVEDGNNLENEGDAEDQLDDEMGAMDDDEDSDDTIEVDEVIEEDSGDEEDITLDVGGGDDDELDEEEDDDSSLEVDEDGEGMFDEDEEKELGSEDEEDMEFDVDDDDTQSDSDDKDDETSEEEGDENNDDSSVAEDEDENESEDQYDEQEVEEDDDKTVRMGNVETIGVCEANIVKRTRGRLATAHPLKSQLNKLRTKLEMLNLTKTAPGEIKVESEESSDEGGRAVKIMEPERVSHTEEAVRKIRQRKATCINPNLAELRKLIKSATENIDSEEEEDKKDDKDGHNRSIDNVSDSGNRSGVKFEPPAATNSRKAVKMEQEFSVKKCSNRSMRLMNQKVNKIKKKYAQDDEETQELRRMLTGSKKMQTKKVNTTVTQGNIVGLERFKDKYKGKEKEILTINEKELENYMNQLSCLTKQLKEDDDVINVIPMCAPYSAIKNYKNVLKLVPGNAKKGTIATQSLQYFIKNDQANAHYLKLITTDQLTLTLIGNCKFTTSKM